MYPYFHISIWTKIIVYLFCKPIELALTIRSCLKRHTGRIRAKENSI
ncbi:unnamed protein product [marine sediment metagenome]|uniref:Uncharacterized protein n=1 Tax=marine sediment metagenome TaxID=412755 RepID=X0WXZ1_9ZZZZ